VLNSDGAGFARHLLDYLAGMEYLRGQDQASREAFSVLAPPRGEVPLLSGTDLSKPMVVGVAEDAVVAFGMAAALRGVADPAVELQRLFAEVIGENYPGKRIVDKWCGVDCSRHIDHYARAARDQGRRLLRGRGHGPPSPCRVHRRARPTAR
jgi:hypothetical protein